MNGFIILHGKHSGPDWAEDCALFNLSQHLKQSSLVDFQTYPWGVVKVEDKHYFRKFEDCLDQIDQAITTLRNNGATKIFLVGHSMGGNASLFYATQRNNFNGIVLLAPAHNTHLPFFAKMHEWSVNKARDLMSMGLGAQVSHFADLDSMGSIEILEVPAENYYSMLNKDGNANMQTNSRLIKQPINVLCISGTRDKTQAEIPNTVWNHINKSDKSKFLQTNDDHSQVCMRFAEILDWVDTI